MSNTEIWNQICQLMTETPFKRAQNDYFTAFNGEFEGEKETQIYENYQKLLEEQIDQKLTSSGAFSAE